MNSAICTLYERHYHYGVAAFINSLHANGFRGDIYIGYRGELPPWATTAESNSALGWKDVKTLEVKKDLHLHFLLIDAKHHFANYKSYFMLELLESLAKNKKSLFYFDPDIIIKQSWSFFENWVNYQVITVCEDVNSPLAEFHPRRLAWREDFKKSGLKMVFKDPIYVNAGFVGLVNDNKSFLKNWIKAQEVIANLLGGVEYSPFYHGGKVLPEEANGPFAPYSRTDQDALNVAIELWDKGKVSFIGKPGMTFGSGANLMSHALGSPKPWEMNILSKALKGRVPKNTDTDYWNHCEGPIKIHSTLEIKRKKLAIIIAKIFTIVLKR